MLRRASVTATPAARRCTTGPAALDQHRLRPRRVDRRRPPARGVEQGGQHAVGDDQARASTPVSGSRRPSRSSVSVTGISSGVVTIATPVTAGSSQDVEHPLASGHERGRPDQIADHLRRSDLATMCPVASASTTRGRSAARAPRSRACRRPGSPSPRARHRPRSRTSAPAGRCGRASGILTNSRRYSRSESSVFIAIANRLGLDSRGIETERAAVEGVGERTLGVHLAHERATPVTSRELARARPRRGLPDATLAGDEEPGRRWGEASWKARAARRTQPPKPMRRSPSAVPIST